MQMRRCSSTAPWRSDFSCWFRGPLPKKLALCQIGQQWRRGTKEVQFSSVRSLDRLGRRGDMRYDSAESLFTTTLHHKPTKKREDSPEHRLPRRIRNDDNNNDVKLLSAYPVYIPRKALYSVQWCILTKATCHLQSVYLQSEYVYIQPHPSLAAILSNTADSLHPRQAIKSHDHSYPKRTPYPILHPQSLTCPVQGLQDLSAVLSRSRDFTLCTRCSSSV